MIGFNSGDVTKSFSTVAVSGSGEIGGLVGAGYGSVVNCVWDIETSGLSSSAGGVGLMTFDEKHDISIPPPEIRYPGPEE